MWKYDPHYFPDAPAGQFDTIYCGYVLNVVTKAEGKRIITDIQRLLRDKRSRAYIVVRRDIKKEGKTSKGTYQRNVVLERGNLHYRRAGYAMYSIGKTDKIGVK